MAKTRVTCTFCDQGLLVPERMLDDEIKCPKCGEMFFVPQFADDEPEELDIDDPRSPIDVRLIDEGDNEPSNPFREGQSVKATVYQFAGARSSGDQQSKPIAAPTPPGPDYQRCNYCHEFIPNAEFWQHRSQHTNNGEIPTLPPEQRYQGSLDGVPDTYYHAVCGQQTTMSEDIIRTTLGDPYFYAYSSFCVGCSRQVRHRELTWSDTGESLHDYYERIKRITPGADKMRNRAIRNWLLTSLIGAAPGLLIGAIAGVFLFGCVGMLMFGLFGAVAGYGAAVGILYWLRGGV